MAKYSRPSLYRPLRKGVRIAGQGFKKRYISKNKKLKLGKIIRDVSVVKRMLNAEKKMNALSVNGQLIGQVSGNISGMYYADITPTPPNGTGGSEKTGRSIKMCSWHAQMQLIQQSNAIGRQNFKIEIYQVLGSPVTPATFATQYWFANGFVNGGNTIIDYNSNVNPDFYGRYKKIYSKRVTLMPDSVSGQTDFKTISMGGKLNHHIRFDGASTTVANGQLLLVIRTDSGNVSPSVVSTLTNIPQTAVSTGALLNYQIFRYYYDN